jgi:hypothetical protein
MRSIPGLCNTISGLVWVESAGVVPVEALAKLSYSVVQEESWQSNNTSIQPQEYRGQQLHAPVQSTPAS